MWKLFYFCLCFRARARRFSSCFSSIHVFILFGAICTWKFSRANAVDIAQFDTCIISRDILFICNRSLNKMPQSISSHKKEVSIHIRQRAGIFMPAFFPVFDAPAATSAARNDCDAHSEFNPMMILNNDEREETKKCAKFFNKIYWLQQRNSFWWDSYVSDGIKQTTFSAYQLILFSFLILTTYNIFLHVFQYSFNRFNIFSSILQIVFFSTFLHEFFSLIKLRSSIRRFFCHCIICLSIFVFLFSHNKNSKI